MALISIRTFGDPVLKERASDVEVFDAALAHLANDMFDTMYDAPGVGLAAPQIGLSIRFFVYDSGESEGGGEGERERGIVANPVLSEFDGELQMDEGCLSVPGLYYPTARSERVRLDGRDVRGGPFTLYAEGHLARIFQHETDHTNGIIYLDRLTEVDRRQAMAELRARELGRPAEHLRHGH